MKAKLMMTLAGLGLLLVTVPVWAHHAFAAEFDSKKPVHLQGSITKIEWINPHTWIHMNVKNADGTTVEWSIEGGTPNTLYRRGITRDTVPVGVDIVVDGYQSKDGSYRANGRDITLPNGRKFFLANDSAEGAADSK